MASRPIVPQQTRVEGLGDANKQGKKNVAGGLKNRRVLGDIGNLAVDVKGIPQRPLTRSFCAQLIANAQAAAVGEVKEQKLGKKEAMNGKVNVPLVPTRPNARQVNVPNARQVNAPNARQVNVQPNPPVVIELSPESHRSFTSTLTARSRALEVIDIDAADVTNHLTGAEYVEDLYKYYKEAEDENVPCKYMVLQPEINSKMRAILVDWLIDVHNRFDLSLETLYLTINIIDRFLSVKTVPKKELQLLGMGAIFTASKYEEIWAPEANDLVLVSDRAYTQGQILLMEKAILQQLSWTLTVPTHYVFLERFIKASVPDKIMEDMVHYLAELGLMNYEMMVDFRPSIVAASAVYAARCTLSMEPSWTDTLKAHTGYSENQLKECAGLFADLHSKAREETKLRAVNKKYQNGGREGVLNYRPAKSLLLPGRQ